MAWSTRSNRVTVSLYTRLKRNIHPSKRCDILRHVKNFQQTDKFQNKELRSARLQFNPRSPSHLYHTIIGDLNPHTMEWCQPDFNSVVDGLAVC
jgi:hypothetical protein